MLYCLNKKYQNFDSLFNFAEFINLLKNNNCLFNFNNEEILHKLKKTYDLIVTSEGKFNKDDLKKCVYDFYGLKNRNCFSRESMYERGFSNEEITKILSENAKKAKANRKINFNNIYHFGNYSFKLSEQPKCKLCGSELSFAIKNNGELQILKCKNENCESNKNKTKKKYAIYPDEILKIIKEKDRHTKKSCIEYWLDKGYSKEDALKQISIFQKHVSECVKNRRHINKEHIKNLYGQEKSEQFFKERSIWCEEFWVKRGYTLDESKEKIEQYQKENAQKFLKKVTKEDLKRKSPKCVEYWIKRGYSESEAVRIISDSQKTFSLQKCIEKYGEEKGYEKWEERQKKWQQSLHENGFHQFYYSNISQDLFEKIEKEYTEKDKEYLFYGKKNKEYSMVNNKGTYYRFDFCDLKRKKVIEFNGDIYHGNPKIFKPSDKPNPFHKDKTCEDLWEEDKIKRQTIENNDFQELIVWENDYRENPDKVFNICLNFLLNE